MLAHLLPLVPQAQTATPGWVDRFPHDADAYIGIGHVDKRNHPSKYRELAQAAALSQISREISIQVKTENHSVQTETNKVWEETYLQRISTVSENALFGYELVDTYETELGFWAYYSLGKPVFEKSLDDQEDQILGWLDQETASLKSTLTSRKIQSATIQFNRMETEYKIRYLDKPWLQNRNRNFPSLIPKRFSVAEIQMNQALANLDLFAVEEIWNKYSMKNGHAGIFLRDKNTHEKWSGPFVFLISNPEVKAPGVCRIESDAEGQVNLDIPFLECGLDPGRWVISWAGPVNISLHHSILAAWIKSEVGIKFHHDGIALAPNDINQLSQVLSAIQSPFYQILLPSSSQGYSHGNMNIYIGEFTVDSLEGMYFATLHARLTLPGSLRAFDVVGKSGNANKEKARSRALADLASTVETLLNRNPIGLKED